MSWLTSSLAKAGALFLLLLGAFVSIRQGGKNAARREAKDADHARSTDIEARADRAWADTRGLDVDAAKRLLDNSGRLRK